MSYSTIFKHQQCVSYKMDTYIFLSLILGILKFTYGDNMLRCIECEHINWNRTYNFAGVENIYQLLQSKYNPACAQLNPRDQNMYNQNYQNQQNQQPLPNQPGNNFYQNRYDVRETICPVYADTNRCNYVYGIATVYLPSYKATMSLEMHVRNCIDASADVENGCYRRDTNYGYFEVKHFFQDRLQFLGSATVERFMGNQCYCNRDLCYPNINSGSNLVASISSIVLAVLTFILVK